MSTPFKIDRCGAILLAAGASTRLGKPKQLLSYKGRSFLQNTLAAAIGANLQPIIVVLGANSEFVAGQISGKNIHVVQNHEWAEGIASSIRCGVRALENIDPASDGAILMVCDQPYITSALLSELRDTQRKTMKPIAAAHYSNVSGTPSLFHKIFFRNLLLLRGDRGASKILRDQTDVVANVPFPMGAIDIDTSEDYEKLEQDGS